MMWNASVGCEFDAQYPLRVPVWEAAI